MFLDPSKLSNCPHLHYIWAMLIFTNISLVGCLSVVYRLWRVPATLPYPDLIFTTRTLPGKVLEISGFRVVTIHAVSTQDDQWCQLFSSGGKGFSFIIPLYTGFRNMQVTICQKHSSWTNITTSCNYDCNFEVFTLFCRTASEIFHSIIFFRAGRVFTIQKWLL